MQDAEIVAFARSNLEPLGSDAVRAYRCAAYLTDGLYLPCVLLVGTEPHTELAVRRFAQTLNRRDPRNPVNDYRAVVKSFVATGSRLAGWSIARLERSPFAIPLARYMEIGGETSMSWTQFTATMRDGREFVFGTTYERDFFEMPKGYTADDIVKVAPAAPLTKRSQDALRERPCFRCFVDGL